MKCRSSLNILLLIASCYLPLQCSLPGILAQPEERPIQVPDGIDGTRYGINGHEIKKLLIIIKLVDGLLDGTLDGQTHIKRGNYHFNHRYVNVRELAQIEQENPPLDAAQKKELQDLLEIAIKDFIEIATPFVKQARSVKQITIKFMEEWARKHDKEDSYILHWSKETDGDEFDTFKEETKTFAQLCEFCMDLVSFTSDLVMSCPRACEQFKELQQKGHAMAAGKKS